jgi:hypothetical protein
MPYDCYYSEYSGKSVGTLSRALTERGSNNVFAQMLGHNQLCRNVGHIYYCRHIDIPCHVVDDK